MDGLTSWWTQGGANLPYPLRTFQLAWWFWHPPEWSVCVYWCLWEGFAVLLWIFFLVHHH